MDELVIPDSECGCSKRIYRRSKQETNWPHCEYSPANESKRDTFMAFLSYSSIQRRAVLLENRRLQVSKAATVQGNVFLSHCTRDDDKIKGVIDFLSDFGVRVYVDDLDMRLPKPPSVDTASILKDEIKASSRLIVLVSPASQDSRWIPWELGLADGFKGVSPIAILPITPYGEEEEWAKEEYFALYPRIYERGGTWYVMDPRDGKPWTLSGWIK